MEEDLKIRKTKLDLLISAGFTADIDKGIVYNYEGETVGSLDNRGYLKFSFTFEGNKIHVRAHQFIYYIATGEAVNCIDHINGVKNDNKISNLRSVTNQQNQFNRIVKGYSWDKKTNKWKSTISVDGKGIHLGMFEIEEDAQNAYLQAKEKYHRI